MPRRLLLICRHAVAGYRAWKAGVNDFVAWLAVKKEGVKMLALF